MNNIDLENIWKQQPDQQPDWDELKDKLKKYRRKNLIRNISGNLSLILTVVFLVAMFFFFKPVSWSNKLGYIIIIASILMMVYFNLVLMKELFNINPTLPGKQYIEQLLKIKKKNHFVQNVILTIYFIFLSLGLTLAVYPYFLLMKPIYAVLGLVLTMGWLGFNWFYIRPRVIQKQTQSLEKLINQLKSFGLGSE